jgi:murein DD-endopeptidase MepM/ murein hydrolase activator NlpD
MNKRILISLLSILILSACSTVSSTMPTNPITDKPITETKTNNVVSDTTDAKTSDITSTQTDTKVGKISEPISNALTRVTKKPFGIKISPKNSPVSPEKFAGYHTGVDFETLPDEQDSEVDIFAICTGDLVLKKRATGYGGAVVQKCTIDGSDVTVIYGHLKLESITAKIGQNLNSGDQIGLLGKDYSAETDGERKHLHLGIHKGAAISLLGYVQVQSQLSNWIDTMTLLK